VIALALLGDPREALERKVKELKADVLVVGSHGTVRMVFFFEYCFF
jgi:nucleotide-binding universal stress UspA family protein